MRMCDMKSLELSCGFQSSKHVSFISTKDMSFCTSYIDVSGMNC